MSREVLLDRQGRIVAVNMGGSGATDGYLPRINVNGQLKAPTTSFTYTLPSGVTTIPDQSLMNSFSESGLSGILNFSQITNIGNQGFMRGCAYCSNLTGVNLSSLSTLSREGLRYTFANCNNLTGNIDLSRLQTIDPASLRYTFANTAITSIDLSSVNSISSAVETSEPGYYEGSMECTFMGCSNLSSFNLSSLSTIGYMGMCDCFSGCSSLTSANLSSVTYVDEEGLSGTFGGCSALTSVDMSNLTAIGSYGLKNAFSGCSNLTSVNLSSLEEISDPADCGLEYAFCECTSLSSLSFPSFVWKDWYYYIEQEWDDESEDWIEYISGYVPLMTNMLYGVTGCTVHFKSSLQSTDFVNLPEVLNGFGGTNTTILFDLP